MSRSVYKTLFSLAFLILVALPLGASANTLFISPSSDTYRVGQTFSVRIMVGSSAQAVNAVSAVLSFPNDKLQVTSISKIGSILNLWVEEPSFSNTAGTVSLEGVVPNPGFTGSNGPVVTINFRAIETGTATLRFSSGSLLANDGYGTNILRTRGTASYTISATPPPPTSTVEEPPVEEPEPYIDLNKTDIKTTKVPEPAPEENVVSFSIPSLESVYLFLLKFLSVVIPIVALIFFLIHTTKKGTANIRALRKDLRSIDRLVEKSFVLMKEDISESIYIMEKARIKRRLTAEEDEIIHRLRQNLVDAERVIHQEVAHAEKDLSD